jgi:uncharacterized protein (TIGR02246 family)
MVTWGEFAAAQQDLADIGRSLLFQFKVGLAFLATVRKDGAPRLHPVCPVLSNDRLFVLVTATSPKRHDLLRDGRYALQTFPQPKPGSDEFYIAGSAVLVEDQATRADILRDAKHMAETSETAFELWIDRVMHTTWEHVLTPQMRSQHRRWRAPATPAAPTRNPADCDRLFAEYMTAGDLEALMTLYEDGATLVQHDGQMHTGHAAIAEVLGRLVAMRPTLQVEIVKVVSGGDDLAVVYDDWTLTATAADGSPVRRSGKAIEVVRRQGDGTWRVVCDDPFARG